jgi:glucose-fructose oxidoreductase
VYCLNAARYLFRAEPTEVSAQRFGETRASEATMSVSLRFPGDRVANFVCSFGAFPTGDLQVVGTQGKLTIENAYEYLGKKTLRIETPRGKRERSFATRDQFGAELLYFSDCVLQGREPEPSGQEGLADVRVIQAALKSADQGRVIKLAALPRAKRLKRPTLAQEIRLPKVGKAKLVATKEPSRETAA